MRHDVPDVVFEPVHEFPRRLVTFHERHHRPIAARTPAQRGHEMRIRQAPDVEDEIGVARQPVLVAEAQQRQHQLRRPAAARQRHEELAQLVDGHVGRVDDFVGELPDGAHARPLVADAFGHRPIVCERVRTPGLAEPSDERVVTGLEEDQHRIEARHRPQAREDLRKRRQQVFLTDVDDDRDLVDLSAAQRQLRQRRNERRRKVVDAEVPEVFERANRLGLSGSREAGQNDEGLLHEAVSSSSSSSVSPAGDWTPARSCCSSLSTSVRAA